MGQPTVMLTVSKPTVMTSSFYDNVTSNSKFVIFYIYNYFDKWILNHNSVLTLLSDLYNLFLNLRVNGKPNANYTNSVQSFYLIKV